MGKIKVMAIAGSLRQGSYNRKLLQLAKTAAADAGADVEEVDLKKLDLPLYDADIEANGMPPQVEQLKAMAESADVLLIASPEYNYSVSGVLKNAIDWLSRGRKNSLGGKIAAIFGASTGPFGTVRGQAHLRDVLTCVNVQVLPQPQVLVKLAAEAFLPDGSLKDEKLKGQLKTLIEKTIETAGKLKA